MSRSAGEAYAKATETWIQERRDNEDSHEYERRGKFNRTVVAEEIGYARSVTGSNPKVKELLENADIEFFGRVSEGPDQDVASHKSAAERAERRTGQIAARNNSLEQRNAELEAEVAQLRREIRAYRERDKLIENGAGGFSL